MAFITTQQDAMLKLPELWGTDFTPAQIGGGVGRVAAGLKLGWHPQGQLRFASTIGSLLAVTEVQDGFRWTVNGGSVEIVNPRSLTFPDGVVWTPERGLTRVNVMLTRKPPVFQWDFQLDLPAGAVAAYQPETLTPEEIERGAFRPDWCKGSYAIFVDDFKHGHMPRPWAQSLVNPAKWTWGTLSVWQDGNGQWWARKAIPAAWFNALKPGDYPVVVDDTFGYDSIGGTDTFLSPDFIDAQGIYSPASNGSATSVSLYTNDTDTFVLGVYADSTSYPGSLLRDTANAAGDGSWKWVQVSLDSALAVTSGTNYWIGFRGQGAINIKADAVGGDAFYYKSSAFVNNALDDPYPAGAASWTSKTSLRVNYTPTAAGSVPVFMHHYTKNIKAG